MSKKKTIQISEWNYIRLEELTGSWRMEGQTRATIDDALTVLLDAEDEIVVIEEE